MLDQPIKKVVIVGGGTAGWMAAASLSQFAAGKELSITLIESTAIGTVGVGEATIPSIVHYNHTIGLDELDFIRATRASFKLGIQFEDWHKQGEQFFHPFADYGINFNGIEFQHYFYRLKKNNPSEHLHDYSIACQLAKHNRFAQPRENPNNPLADYSYAYHFDATLYAKVLRELSLSRGVIHLDEKVAQVNLREADGFITSLLLANGQTVEGDLFIDCTGFKGLLIEETLKTGYEDWQEWLLCDAAVAVQCANTREPTPYTRVTALNAGWMWQIPLQHRMGNGYVFSSRFLSKESATETLLEKISGTPLTQPKPFVFQAGRRKKVWNKNCYALGLASGFLEPLESTSISLIQTGITHLLTFFPDMSFDPAMINEVNRRHQHEMERIRDFIILHYKLTQRDDTEFWRYCQSMTIPDSLQHKIDLFKSCGHIVQHEPEAFEKSSWLSIYHGFAVTPERTDNRIDHFKDADIKVQLEKIKASLAEAGQQATRHEDFIRKHCAAPDFE
ncbi:tryptophan halogenase family protein [Cellvibrio sp. OA-2007]|uniref:tryptophan halogenase family protein n=1 Tax=Cellvibrio sp. OA-2007 TaxID=529823 RepID=UPI000B33629F|nr:tryptophan halogenase family protein [Cellvibrio sp. OA-2007]